MSNNKKPTMMEVKYAITNLISEFGNLRDHVMKMDNIFSDYIKFRNQEDNFKSWLEKKYIKKEDKDGVVLPDKQSKKTTAKVSKK